MPTAHLPGLPRNDQRPSRPPTGRIARGTTGNDILVGAEPPAAPSDGMWQTEPFLLRWGRRAITIPGFLLVAVVYGALMPLILIYAALSDLIHRRPLLLVRFHLTLWAIVAWHCVGFGALLPWWIIGKATRMPKDRWRQFHRALEGWWAHNVLAIATLMYGTRYVAEDLEVVAPGPVIMLSRHASTLDTMLPLRMLGHGPLKMISRMVQKHSLLWDPCVDLMAHRVPRTFVRRGTTQIGGELEKLERLCDDMGAHDAVVIFPEGTRFTPEKQAEVMAKLQVKMPETAAWAARLKHVLPPRPVGTLTLLEARPEMDVVFCAHTGLEETNKLDDLINGSLLRRTVKAKFWRVPRAEVPLARDERIAWLHAWWERVDRWIDENRTTA